MAFVLFLLLFGSRASAQVTVSGQVTDAKDF